MRAMLNSDITNEKRRFLKLGWLKRAEQENQLPNVSAASRQPSLMDWF